ncbi:citrate lyase acyl carrier protein [Coriobacterium glomerans PW2]|uniref:Citrate lyase acyl carrier protein n=1 Tax=Coriobacterium glomerans (strain ATCC 49209 / DSM 20642 / JCM 10262 / PW2) TaxID=700015 RepID=F2NBF3_CORGP|nr:citrate lyase acyl carrier protein [Coriobacterium glomerans]AEB06689.1 citrate lyase acyl carrier protein [Coriobacterium glomerans PW2]
MEIQSSAIAGTLESSDIQITVSRGDSGIQIELTSDVEKQFGAQIRKVITDALQALGISRARVKAVDKGALDCVIRARTLTAAQRGAGMAEEPVWEAL